MPEGQSEHAAEPASEKVPGPHGSQAGELTPLQVPAGHMAQPAPLRPGKAGEPAWPAAQTAHAAGDEAPPTRVEVPLGQDAQLAWPDAAAYEPGPQIAQLVALAAGAM